MNGLSRGWRSALLAALGLAALPADAQTRYGPGASDVEVRVGHIGPYSGPASAFGLMGKTIAAYFSKVNAEGGVNGRKITFLTYDDAYSPTKAVEHARRLVESDRVLLVFQSLGTPSNAAIQRYMNERGVPQLFVASGAARFGDPAAFPWTMGWQPSYQSEGRAYARYVLANHPGAKVAILHQNDDFGREYVKGFKEGLGDGASAMIVAEQAYEVSDPSVDSQVVTLKASGADVFLDASTAKAATQAIRKAHDLGWRPVHIVASVSASVGSVLAPAGLAASKGVLSVRYLKDPTDAAWRDDPATREWRAFMDAYFREGDRTSNFTVFGYTVAQTLVEVLRRCGDDLTRESVMRQAASLKDLSLPMLLPGITIRTGPDDFFPVEQMQMHRFDGERWGAVGPVLDGEVRSGRPRGAARP